MNVDFKHEKNAEPFTDICILNLENAFWPTFGAEQNVLNEGSKADKMTSSESQFANKYLR